MTCSGCKWFDKTVTYGRQAVSCKTLGVKPEDSVCLKFKDCNSDNLTIPVTSQEIKQKVETGIGTLSKQSNKDIIVEILSEIFVLEQDKTAALHDWKLALQQQGANVTLDDSTINSYAQRLIDVFALHRLIHLFGMGHLYDTIMGYELANQWNRTPLLKKEIEQDELVKLLKLHLAERSHNRE